MCLPKSFLVGMANAEEVDDYFKPYSRRKEIMLGYAKQKAKEALLEKGRQVGPKNDV